MSGLGGSLLLEFEKGGLDAKNMYTYVVSSSSDVSLSHTPILFGKQIS